MKNIKYKLTIIRVLARDEVEEVCNIGLFDNERELQQWTEDNLGEIEKEFKLWKHYGLID